MRSLAVALSWDDFNNHPDQFDIILSAEVSSPSWLPSTVTFSGSITGVKINVTKLLHGQNPIESIDGGGITIGGSLMGGTLDATVIIGTVKFDAQGNVMDPADTNAPASTVFFGAIQGSLDLPGLGTVGMRLAVCDYGPLSFYIEAPIPLTILPQFGITLTNFRGGIDFGLPLATPTDPRQLRGGQYQPPLKQDLATWEAE